MIDRGIERVIKSKVLNDWEQDRALHRANKPTPSGNLTASMLGDPLQWIVLKMIGVEAPPPEEYALRLFERGNDTERWIINKMGWESLQKDIVYKGVTGKIDAAEVDTSSWDNPVGKIPVEVKSIKNSQFKYIANEKYGNPKFSHTLQATLYALAENADHYALVYVAADDYRTHTFLRKTTDPYIYPEMKRYGNITQEELVVDPIEEINYVITESQRCLKEGQVPVFLPRQNEKWQENDKYNRYPSFRYLTSDEIDLKLEREYPEAFKKLKRNLVNG